jgi:hypothetical protein
MRLSEIDHVLLESVGDLLSREVRGEFQEMLSETQDYERRSLVQIRELFEMDGDPDGWDRFRRAFMGNVSHWYLAGMMRSDPVEYDWLESLHVLWLLSPKIFVYACCCVMMASLGAEFAEGSSMKMIFQASSGAYPLMLHAANEAHEGNSYSDVTDWRLGIRDDVSVPLVRMLEQAMLETMFTKPKFLSQASRTLRDSKRVEPVVRSRVVQLLRRQMAGSMRPNDFYALVRKVLVDYENGELYMSTREPRGEPG